MLISSYSSVSPVIEISSLVKTLNSTTFESSFFLAFSFIVFILRNYFFYFHIGIFFFNRRLDSFVTAQQVPGTEAFSKSIELKEVPSGVGFLEKVCHNFSNGYGTLTGNAA